MCIGCLGAGRLCAAQDMMPVQKNRWQWWASSPKDGPGWTTFVQSSDTRIVYISSSTGDDANSGLSPDRAKKSMGAGYAMMRDGFPDWLLLKRGDTWNDSFPEWQKGGRAVGEPMVIGSYGTGSRPLLKTGTAAGLFASAYPGALGHLALTDIHFFDDRFDGTSPAAGVTVLNRWSDVLIENCMVEGYPINIVVQEAPERPSNVRIRRCVIVDAYSSTDAHSQGIFAGGTDGLLIEDCVVDYNGWRRGVPGAQATIFNHDMYLHASSTGVVTRGNICARGSATGISQRSGGICENNLLLLNPTAIFMGATEQPGIAERGAVRNNVVLDGRDIDTDARRGFGIWLGGCIATDVYGNIVASQRTGSGNVVAFNLESDLRNVQMYRNLVYDWSAEPDVHGVAVSVSPSLMHGVLVCDNQFQQVAGGFLTEIVGQAAGDIGSMFARNRYYTANQPPHVFYYGTDYVEWLQLSGEPWSSYGLNSYPAPGRTIESYMESLGLQATVDEFLSLCRQQERFSWDPRFTAAAVNAYIQQGYGMTSKLCRADFNDDGVISALDVSAFQNAFAAHDPRADIDQDGAFTVLDAMYFQAMFAAGCP
jgi:hypothetical protein